MGWKKKTDISIRFVPNLLSEEGRQLKFFSFNRNWTIRRYLKKSGFDFENLRVCVNGTEVKDLRKHLNSGDEIFIYPGVEFTAIGLWLGAKAAAAFWVGLMAVVTAVTTVYSVVSALTMRPRTPSFGTIGDGMDEGSATNSWDGVRTTADVGGPVPVIYGTRLYGGKILNEYVSTDGDKNYLNSLIAIGEGELDSITLSRINRNPAENYSNYTLETRLGTNSQSVIPHFEDLHSLKSVSVKLEKDTPYIYTTELTDVEAFEIHFQLPSGLWQQDSSGGISGWSVTYQVEYKVHTDGAYTDLGSFTISDKSRTVLERIFRKEGLTAAQYDIRITRTSDDSDFQNNGDLYLHYVDEINTDDLEYPNTAIAGIRSLAVDQLSNANPDYEFLVRGKKVMVPKVMNGAVEVGYDDYYWDPDASCYKLFSDSTALTWDGVTYSTLYSANPIWCSVDFMTNTRLGLGRYLVLSDADLDHMIEMSQHCDERVPDGTGGYEKRFRMDIVIDSPQKALELILQLSTIFRGLPFFSDLGKIRIAIDKPDLPVQLFGMGNIKKGTFSETWGSLRDIPTIVQVQFDDKDKNYETDIIEVEDEEAIAAGRPRIVKQVRYFGTKLSYAIRHGRNIIKSAKLSQAVKFTGGISAFVRQVAEVIDVAHDVPQWGFSGKVQAGSTTTKVKLDRTVTIEIAKTYKILVDLGKGVLEERFITDLAGDYTEVNVDSAFSTAPAEFQDYSFGESTKVVKPFRISSLKRFRNCEVDIEAVEYSADAYDDSTVVIPESNYTSLSDDIPNVLYLKLTERMAKLGDGTVEDVIDVWFQKPDIRDYYVDRYAAARIYLSEDDGVSWEFKGETSGTHFQIMGGVKDLQEYKVAVVSVSAGGTANAITDSPQESIPIIGKSAPPEDVASFLVNQSRDRLYFGWPHVSDVDLAGYEIRFGDSWEVGEVLVKGIEGNSHIALNFREGASQKFFIKALDTSKNPSLNATEAVITIDNIPFTNIIESYSEQTAWSGTKTNVSKVGNNLEIDSTYLTGTYVTSVRDLGFVATFKIGIEAIVVDASTTERMDDSLTDRMNDSLTERMSGNELTGAASFEISTSEDNSTWSDYRAWQAGDYKCRYFKIRMTLTRSDVSKTIQCSQLNYYADLPDVDEVQYGTVSVADDGCAITFDKTFHKNPALNITITSGDGFVWKASSLSTTGVTIKLYDLSGTTKTGDFTIHIHGV